MNRFVFFAIVVAVGVFFIMRNNSNKEATQLNIKLGAEFLAVNKLEEEVIETSSGLQYKVLTHGSGVEHPNATSKVTVHYHGTLIDGTVFDSSVERGEPISFGLNQVIKGWTEGLQLMVVGDKVRFYIPSSLGYGNRPAGKILPGSLLIFDVELLSFK